MSIQNLIDNAGLRCTKCGKQSFGGNYTACGCWVACKCGWHYAKDGACSNPIHGGPEKPMTVIAHRSGRKKK